MLPTMQTGGNSGIATNYVELLSTGNPANCFSEQQLQQERISGRGCSGGFRDATPFLSFTACSEQPRCFFLSPFLSMLKRRRGLSGKKRVVDRRASLTFATLGFSADPRVGIERAATALMKDVASLLVFQDIFRSPQAQAFLKVLLALRRDGLKLLDLYGEFFRLMAVSGYASWEDYILDGVLIGEANPFAEAIATHAYPASPWFGGIPSSLEVAAAADLEALQRLSILESTLSGWVADLCEAKPEWRSAVASGFGCNVGGKDFDADGVQLGLLRSSNDDQTLFDMGEIMKNSSVIHNLIAKRGAWRKKVGGLWKWSEAVPLLKEYYAKNGVGRVATSQVLLVKGGKLMHDLKFFLRRKNHCELSIHGSQREEIVRYLREHCLSYSPIHLLLCGPTGAGKSALLHSIFQKLVCEGDIHIITMPEMEIKYLGNIIEELGKFSNLRFVLVIDDPLGRVGEENLRIIKSVLNEDFQDCPGNVLLILTSSRSELYDGTTSYGEGSTKWVDLKQTFGRVIVLAKLSFDQFVQTVQEMLEQKNQKGFPVSIKNSEKIGDIVNQWTEQHGINLSSAAQLVKSLR